MPYPKTTKASGRLLGMGLSCLIPFAPAQASLITQTVHHSGNLFIEGEYGHNLDAFSEQFHFQRFDPSLGRLRGVSLQMQTSLQMHASIGDWSGEGYGAVLLEGLISCGVEFDGGMLSLSSEFFGSSFRDFVDTPYDELFGPFEQSLEAQVEETALQAFVGAGTIAYQASIWTDLFFLVAVPETTDTSATRAWIDFFLARTDADLHLTLQYDYEPAHAVPEPAPLLPLAAGLLWLASARRRHLGRLPSHRD